MDVKKLLSKDFLEKLKYKLSTGNARSIYLNCIPGRYKGRLELAELEEVIPDSSEKFINQLFADSTFVFDIDIPSSEDKKDTEIPKEIKEARQLLKARLEYLIAEEKTLRDNFGISTLNFGYPVIAYKKSKDSKFIYAPLLLWEIGIQKDFNKKNSYKVARNPDHGVRFNDMLSILLEDDAQIKIDPIDDALLSDGLLDAEETLTLVNKLNKQIFKEAKDINLDNIYPKLDKDNIITSQWINTGVFGHFRHLKTPIINEVKRLIKEFQDGNITFIDEEYKPENILTSVELDPSQQKVIEALKESKHRIIQGPPGTGKSQTITAIVANVLANKGKCLVICEKDVALNVIKENLIEAGISSNMVLKITDPIFDRRNYADYMSNILDKPTEYTDFQDTALELTVKNSDILKQKYNQAKKKLYSKDILNIPFRDLIGKLSSINRNYEFQRSLSTNFDSYENINIQNLKDSIAGIEPKFRKIEEKLHILSNFENEFILHLNPIDYQTLKVNLFTIKDDIATALEQIRSVNEKTGNKFLNKKADISIFDKVLSLFSKEIKLINENIITLNEKVSEINGKRIKIPVSNKELVDDDLIQEQYKELTSQIEYIEQLIGIDQALVYDYKDLITTLNQIDTFTKQVYEDIVRSPDLKANNNWHILFEKSLIEYFLQKDLKNSVFYTGETLDSYINGLIQGEEKIHQLNTARINDSWRLSIANLKSSQGWSNAKFYLTQKRQSQKRGPRKSLQQLFRDHLNEILTISPVVLTNPITANVLFTNKEKIFDVVLFDEASQLRLEDTVTCMLLGKKVIVSGDKHQMPPSDYFDNGQTFGLDDPDIEPIDPEPEPTDPWAESLLAFSYSISNYFDDIMLECHYRSRHPDLIDFSNYAFYGSRLLPMPAKEKERPIKFIQVDGLYQQKKRVNEDEAKAMINLLKSDEIKEDLSVGIATLNINQRDLIREFITSEIEVDEAFRNKILKLEENGLFIKNLENIQGDERDVIILSVTFGVTEDKKFRHSFGQLNNKHKGYRLLNVLVTRAKQRLYIFNSIPKVEFNRFAEFRQNKSEILSGRGALFAYLAYANAVSEGDIEAKKHILNEIMIGSDEKKYQKSFSESPFEEEVYSSLLTQIDPERIVQQYEAGGFRIDMVVLDENKEPLLAIECDGASYHSSEEAHGWDMYRQKMLERMGFKFHRIWSTDWWVNYKKEIGKLIDKLNQETHVRLYWVTKDELLSMIDPKLADFIKQFI